MTSRRSVLRRLAAAPFSLPFLSAAQARGGHWLLLGTHDGEGIYRAAWNPASGGIGPAELVVKTERPTWLTRHPRLPVIYACNEMDGDNDSSLSAFSLADADGRPSLQHLGTEPTHGGAPCHASVSPDGRLLFTANYTGGSLSVFPLQGNGTPRPADTVFRCKGNVACGVPGPNKERQDTAHIHCAVLSPDGRFVLSCDLGDDSILIFPLTQHGIGTPQRIAAPAGSGPRHLVFHPDGKRLYCIHELACSITCWTWDPSRKPALVPSPKHTVSLLPAGVSHDPESTGAEIAISRDGRFLYGSTRGADLISVFAIQAGGAGLHGAQQIACGGKKPRFFALDPTNNFLVCANQDSNSLTVFRRDRSSGKLQPLATTAAPNPECILWV